MKMKNGLGRIWIAAVGSVCSLLGLAWPGAAVVPPDAGDNAAAEPKSRAARPEPERLKAREISFEDAAGAKNRGAIAQQPDGMFRGVIAQSDGRSKGVIEEPAIKDKATILPPPTPPTKDKAFMIYDPGQEKGHFLLYDPGQEKGHFIPPPPPKDTAFEKSEPAKKDKAVWMADPPATDKGPGMPQDKSMPSPGMPKDKSHPPDPGMPKDKKWTYIKEGPPSRDEVIDQQLLTPPTQQAPAPGPQSLRPGIDYSLLLTQEQKDHVAMGIRDRLWTLNAEGKLERRLAGGVRAIMQEGGWVEVYNAEGQLLSAYQDVRAERIDRATRITDRMKQAVLKMKG